uniref:Uncharacterized protein n=1 Tax=Candidatus Kentrum sp. FM TaxID=2126340 RepID=A0A450TZ95_9GAMM|nr:MAG: hypothetical protein BECKFM1743A_GA0114220_105373 [Candidatus Kentron sp. FM]VFJ75270.1 MAG: hypothetical protein BECKFM1743C_GA0114222_108321 [Candidatus Kentron sp. FM]VFK18011.1 MAG: hypothetical protein BECKFM1743B_GA0114221_105193 [Candidatus Kentron sp. FM]
MKRTIIITDLTHFSHTEIDRLDDRYPELALDIIRRFPHVSSHEPRVTDEGADKWIPGGVSFCWGRVSRASDSMNGFG